MDESNETSERKHPADALADLAAGGGGEAVAPPEQADPLAALDEMAQGGDDMPNPGELAAAAAADDTVEIGGEGDSAILTGRRRVARAPVRAARVSAAAADRHHAHMYKKTMIPLLLMVGLLLILVGLIAVVMLMRAGAGDEFQRWYSRMKVVTFVSFPLAAAMFFGAWWFRRDVNKTRGSLNP